MCIMLLVLAIVMVLVDAKESQTSKNQIDEMHALHGSGHLLRTIPDLTISLSSHPPTSPLNMPTTSDMHPLVLHLIETQVVHVQGDCGDLIKAGAICRNFRWRSV